MENKAFKNDSSSNNKRSFMWAVYLLFAAAFIVSAIVFVSEHILNRGASGNNEPIVAATADPITSEEIQLTPSPLPSVYATASATEAYAESTPSSPFIKTVICIDGNDVLVLASRQAAESLMSSVTYYFESLDLIPAGSVTELTNIVELRDADPETDTTDYDSAFAYLTGGSTPLKYVSKVNFHQDNTVEHNEEFEYTDTLPFGYRLVKVYGHDGLNRITYASTYINGVRKEIIERERFAVYLPVNSVVLIGTAVHQEGSAPDAYFGEDAVLPPTVMIKAPLEGTVVRFFGMYDDEFNHGIDIACPAGAEVRASASGTVVSVLERGSYGKMIDIDHGNGVTTRYAHLGEALPTVGDKVVSGQLIGLVADSYSYPHLHFELRIRGYSYNPIKVIVDIESLDLEYGLDG